VFNNTKTHTAAAMLGVDVTGNSRMTMCIQLQLESYVMMMGL
jgi:hypothetical protein